MNGARERTGVGLKQNEDVIAGCVSPAHEGMGDVQIPATKKSAGRMASLV